MGVKGGQSIVFKFMAHKCSHLLMTLAALSSVTFGRFSIKFLFFNDRNINIA